MRLHADFGQWQIHSFINSKVRKKKGCEIQAHIHNPAGTRLGRCGQHLQNNPADAAKRSGW